MATLIIGTPLCSAIGEEEYLNIYVFLSEMTLPIEKDLQQAANPTKVKVLAGFFKTGKGQYGEGDVFLGITVPEQRKIAQKYVQQMSLNEIQRLLSNRIHEYRLVALLILVEKYKKSTPSEKKRIVDFYLKNTSRINNWDLVDLSADKIIGDYLLDKDTTILTKLASSSSIWEKRIAIIATFAFIKKNQFKETFQIAEQLLQDKHDLIRKAVGWMLREVGKRDQKAEEEFLRRYYRKMPRTMLRYAIERFSDDKRKIYLQH